MNTSFLFLQGLSVKSLGKKVLADLVRAEMNDRRSTCPELIYFGR